MVRYSLFRTELASATLFRLLPALSLLPFSSGTAYVLGDDVSQQAARIRAQIGYMSQKFSLYSDLTTRENIHFYAGIYGLTRTETEQRMAELLDLTGLEPYLDRRAGRLSGGWKQRLALICALLHRPKLVFLDEPTAGVDPVARRDLWNLLFRLAADGITLFVTTHYMDEAERCGRVGYLHLSRLLVLGTPHELRNRPEITPSGTRRLELLTREAPHLLTRLRSRPSVREATIFGQSIHALVNVDDDLNDLEVPDLLIREGVPNLEDVFVTLAREANAQISSATVNTSKRMVVS